MPNRVAVSVRNCATTRQTFAATSWSSLMAIEAKQRATATMNEAVAIVFSRYLFLEFIGSLFCRCFLCCSFLGRLLGFCLGFADWSLLSFFYLCIGDENGNLFAWMM